jgi:hypothetical protein
VTVQPTSLSRPYGAANPILSLPAGNLINFNGNFSSSSLYLNGTARIAPSSLRLNDQDYNLAGSAYFSTPVSISKFTTSFSFQFTNPANGNGMTFVLQNQGPTALGGPGGDMGYGGSSAFCGDYPGDPAGIAPSIAITFGLFNDCGQGSDSTGLFTNGTYPGVPSVDMSNSGIHLDDGDVFQVQINYDGQNLTETITDTVTHATFSHTYTSVNLPQILGGSTAYAGFTTATGYGAPKYIVTDVFGWSYSNTVSSSPTGFVWSFAGLVNGDNVSVDLSTPATPASPVGSYQEVANVTGTALSNYTLTVHDATLVVRKAPLSVVAASELVTYGQTPPPPSSYTLQGFVNHDTVSVVSGAPALSTTVTSATPVGYYPIKVGAGTLTAANYSFEPDGRSTIQVVKAPLTVIANHLTMPQGGPIPTLTWSFTGFVNGDTAATAVTGTPLLATTATTHSRPGTFPIYISTGTLKSSNYHITAVKGTLTITP